MARAGHRGLAWAQKLGDKYRVAKQRYRPGQIIWAKVADRNGVVKPTARPVLVVMVHPVVRTAPLRGLAISTRRDIDPEDPVVEMPWDAKTGSTTGLYEWCGVVLLWAVNVEQSAVEKISGRISDELLAEVGRRLEEARFWRSQNRQ